MKFHQTESSYVIKLDKGEDVIASITEFCEQQQIQNAHFHRAPMGVSGAVVRGIHDEFVGNSASGIWTADDSEALTPELVDTLCRFGQDLQGDGLGARLAELLSPPELAALATQVAAELEPLVELIRQVHSAGKTVLMVEHRMEFVVDVSDRIAVMHQGSILTVGTPAEVMADPTVRTAYLGTEV